MTSSLLETLRTLETALHRPDVRGSAVQMGRLLHLRFRESGRSGRLYTRAEVLSEFQNQPQAYGVWAQDFQVEPLGEHAALLTYRSAHMTSEGTLERHTNRTSVWLRTDQGWQLLFHQGTLSEVFQRE